MSGLYASNGFDGMAVIVMAFVNFFLIKSHERSINPTKYVHIKSTTVYAPRRNWDSPNPFLASECSPPPRNRGEGHTSLRVGGWGESQFRRRAYTVVLFICTYFVIKPFPAG